MPQASLLSFFTGSGGSTAVVLASGQKVKQPYDSSSGEEKDVSAGEGMICSVLPIPPRSTRPTDTADRILNRDGKYERQKSSIVSAVQEAKRTADRDENSFLSPTDNSVLEIGRHLPPTAATSPTAVHTLPNCPSITIATIQPYHLASLARLTSSLLPIKYPWSFYSDITPDSTASLFSRVALYTSPDHPSSDAIPIGWIRCSLEPSPPSTTPTDPNNNNNNNNHSSSNPEIQNQIYIKALCLHPSYRTLGIATALLDSLHNQAPEQTLRQHNVDSLSAHVWVSNVEGLEWYERRGFGKVELLEGYYRKLRPGGAWLVRREVEV